MYVCHTFVHPLCVPFLCVHISDLSLWVWIWCERDKVRNGHFFYIIKGLKFYIIKGLKFQKYCLISWLLLNYEKFSLEPKISLKIIFWLIWRTVPFCLTYRDTHKGWVFKDDCTELILSVSWHIHDYLHTNINFFLSLQNL